MASLGTGETESMVESYLSTHPFCKQMEKQPLIGQVVILAVNSTCQMVNTIIIPPLPITVLIETD